MFIILSDSKIKIKIKTFLKSKIKLKKSFLKLLPLKSNSKALLFFYFFISIFFVDISSANQNGLDVSKNNLIDTDYLDAKNTLEDYIVNHQPIPMFGKHGMYGHYSDEELDLQSYIKELVNVKPMLKHI